MIKQSCARKLSTVTALIAAGLLWLTPTAAAADSDENGYCVYVDDQTLVCVD